MTSFRGSYIPGGGYAICDRCMKRVRIYDLRTEWSNSRVCDRCYDPRPVHLSTPVLKPGEGASLPGARPDIVQEADDDDLRFTYRDGTSLTFATILALGSDRLTLGSSYLFLRV